MKNEILELLRESRDYVSGQELCQRFKVSRTAVWKTIEQLKKDGYIIEAVRNRGYRLNIAANEVYNKAEIEAALFTNYIGRNCFFHSAIGSTNTEAKRLAEDGAPEGTIVVADSQTAGKGRRGRAWVSPSGKNVYFTLLLKPDFQPDRAPMLTLLMALAVAEGIRSCMGDDIQIGIKWPNDIVANGKKVCGILTEMSVEQDYIQYVVIGVGINVKNQQFDLEIADRATSLEAECSRNVARSVLIGAVMDAFEKYYYEFKKNGDLSSFKNEYESMLVNKDKQVRVLDPKGEYDATALGINGNGELLVKLYDGSIREVYAGEVSVRGIYGYV